MQIKTITTVAGVNKIDFGNDDSQTTAHFYWFKNLSDSTLYVSAMSNPVAGEDNVAELSAKGAASVETDEGKVYVLGAGKVEIHRTNSKFCPFELPSTGSGGGGTVDAYSKTESDAKYAQKTDIPTSLPANGGNADYAANADKLDGLHADAFIKANSGGDVAITGNLNVDGYIAGSNANSSDHNHALLMGHDSQDYWDFFEYGGLFRFYKSQSGTDTLLGKITSNGWEGNVVGDVTGSINGWSIYNHINDDDFDVDNAKSIGIYRINAGHGSNLPTANGYDIFVINQGGYITQLAIADNATMYIRYYDLVSWSSWREVYTSGNKPYVTGSVVATSTTITTNHGFQPSAVLYSITSEDYNVRGTLAFDSTSFTALGNISSSGTLVQYIIFK